MTAMLGAHDVSSDTGATGSPRPCQSWKPPARGRTRVMPRARSWSATRALVASLGHVQYSTMSTPRGISWWR
jgi:hypothetical protein